MWHALLGIALVHGVIGSAASSADGLEQQLLAEARQAQTEAWMVQTRR